MEHMKKFPLNIKQDRERVDNSSEGLVTHELIMQDNEVVVDKEETEVCEKGEERFTEVSRKKRELVETPPKENEEKITKMITQSQKADTYKIKHL